MRRRGEPFLPRHRPVRPEADLRARRGRWPVQLQTGSLLLVCNGIVPLKLFGFSPAFGAARSPLHEKSRVTTMPIPFSRRMGPTCWTEPTGPSFHEISGSLAMSR